ncbi:MAG: TcpQ domain-containing protein [Desulfovibrio sp.]|nr:TcpQ domain-containing protein [Desulfovibrio sp.]
MLSMLRIVFVFLCLCPALAKASYREVLEPLSSKVESASSELRERDLGSSLPVSSELPKEPVSLAGRLSLGQALRLILPKDWQYQADAGLLAKKRTLKAQRRPLAELLDSLGERYGFVWQLAVSGKKLLLRAPARKACKEEGQKAGRREQKAEPVKGPNVLKGGQENQKTAGPDYRVEKSCLAGQLARELGLPLRDFCAWNQIGPHTPLGPGYLLYRKKPPAGAQIMASLPSAPKGFSSEKARIPAKEKSLDLAALPEPQVSPKPRDTKHLASAKPQPDKALAVPTAQSAESPATSLRFQLGPGPLSRQLANWCQRARAELVWLAECELELSACVDFGTVFEEAVRALFASLAAQGQALRASFYRANRVLEVRGL